ncbi:hypothetical protein NXW09_29190 [Bacteroides ovatus]|nr:hypothetical protein [Bacteroides ovatus]
MPASGPHAERLVLCRGTVLPKPVRALFRVGRQVFPGGTSRTRLSNVEIYRQIREHMEKVNLHPAIVKKASFVKYVNWYKKTVTYIPYYFEYGGKIYFLKNLATRTGSEFGDRRERNEMAALLRNLRGNRYEYCTFYSQRRTSSSFLTGYGRTNTRWKSRATCSTLRMTAPTWTFTAMYASIRLCSITASIHASFFGHIINQLRTVKRYHAWHKRREIR